MDAKSTRVLQHVGTTRTRAQLFNFLKYLEAADELVTDKAELRGLGLTEEEVQGYEEYFLENYFPTVQEVV